MARIVVTICRDNEMNNAIGLIVGSGFESLGLAVTSRSPTKTPYGTPSSPVLAVTIGATQIACIARHGENHAIPPHAVNYRANIWSLYQHGVRQCLAINAVGAIDASFSPSTLAVPDQLIDYTWGREHTFFAGDGTLEHIEFSEPLDPEIRGRMADAIAAAGGSVRAGTYGVTQGPRLETAAEIDRLERDGCHMVGMTALPEAALAREIGMAYAICAIAVNFAAGRHPDGVPIHAELERHTRRGMGVARVALEKLVSDLPDPT